MYYNYILRNNQFRITINTQNRTLYLYHNNKLINTFPVATGKPLTPTPKGTFRIINKAYNPKGPFGAFWFGLNIKGYGIHGTNNPQSIGKNISNGCIRMYNKDILSLSKIIKIGTYVTII